MSQQFEVIVSYGGIDKTFQVVPEQSVESLLQRAINEFGIPRPIHALGLFLADETTRLENNRSLESYGITSGQVLILRQVIVQGGQA